MLHGSMLVSFFNCQTAVSFFRWGNKLKGAGDKLGGNHAYVHDTSPGLK
jgi:hypothetical protein